MDISKVEGHQNPNVSVVPARSNDLDTVINNNSAFLGTLQAVSDPVQTTAAARTATQDEHNLTIRQAFNLYPQAILFSIGISLAIVMEGFDFGLLGNFYSLPQFRKYYGHELPNGDYQVSAGWQSATSAISQVGGICGLLFAGWIVEQKGFRVSMLFALAFITGAIFITFFAQNIVMLFVGQLICGFPWGMFQGMASSYAADIAPLSLRPFLTSYINLCWALGQFISTGVLKGVLVRQDQWSFRIPFATQWVWPIPIALIVLFAPESPWWLVRKGRVSDARKALQRLSSSRLPAQQLDNAIDLMLFTDEHEKQVQQGTSYRELFVGTNLRRTEIAALTWICQVTCGTWFSSNITYFMEQAGFNPANAFNLGLGMTALSCVGTIASWFITPHVGRRPLYLLGLLGMCITEMIVGFMGIAAPTSALGWASGALLIINNLIFFLTIGPVCYTIVPEIPSVRLRNKTVVFSRSAYLLVALGANFLQPPMLNPTAWNLRGKGALIWAAFCAVSLSWAFFRLPETKGRTVMEMDVLFEAKTPTWQFKDAKVDPFRTSDFGIADISTLVERKNEIGHVEHLE